MKRLIQAYRSVTRFSITKAKSVCDFIGMCCEAGKTETTQGAVCFIKKNVPFVRQPLLRVFEMNYNL